MAAADPSPDWTTTPQGFPALVDSKTGRYLRIELACLPPAAGPDAPMFGFVSPGEALQQALQGDFLFLAAVDPAPFAGFANLVSVAGWRFRIDVGKGSAPGAYRNVLIFKFGRRKLIDLVRDPASWTQAETFSTIPGSNPADLAIWLGDFIDAAVAESEAGNPRYATFRDKVRDGDWNGLLALNLSLEPSELLPSQLMPLAAGFEPDKLRAHHLGLTSSDLRPMGERSSWFGLIDYCDAGAPAGGVETLIYASGRFVGTDGSPPRPGRALLLRAELENSALTIFEAQVSPFPAGDCREGSASLPAPVAPAEPRCYGPAMAASDPFTPEIVFTDSARVACDGATEISPALGHPRVYLQIDEKGYVDCGYCDKRFILKSGPADQRPPD